MHKLSVPKVITKCHSTSHAHRSSNYNERHASACRLVMMVKRYAMPCNVVAMPSCTCSEALSVNSLCT